MKTGDEVLNESQTFLKIPLLERFSMTRTPIGRFLEIPEEFRSPASRFRILPIPYEGTVCFERGTAEGPRRILAVSDQMEYLDEETFCEFYRPGILTLPAIEPEETPEAEMEAIRRAVLEDRLFEDGFFPMILGGEHSVTAPVVRVAAEKYPDLSVLQFDAHSDLRDAFPPGGKNSHASVMRRVLEVVPTIVQVGIRSFSEEDPVHCPQQVKNFITPIMVEEDFSGALETILTRLTDHVYVTIDMYAFDPSIAPGVGTPEPGGLTWRQITRILRAVFREKRVVGADVVETAPLPGSVVTEFLAARLVAKIMTYDTRSH